MIDYHRLERQTRRDLRRFWLTSEQRLVFEALVDWTFAWGRPEVVVERYEQIAAAVGISKGHVSERLRELEGMRMVQIARVRFARGEGTRLRVLPDAEFWQAEARMPRAQIAQVEAELRRQNGLVQEDFLRTPDLNDALAETSMGNVLHSTQEAQRGGGGVARGAVAFPSRAIRGAGAPDPDSPNARALRGEISWREAAELCIADQRDAGPHSQKREAGPDSETERARAREGVPESGTCSRIGNGAFLKNRERVPESGTEIGNAGRSCVQAVKAVNCSLNDFSKNQLTAQLSRARTAPEVGEAPGAEGRLERARDLMGRLREEFGDQAFLDDNGGYWFNRCKECPDLVESVWSRLRERTALARIGRAKRVGNPLGWMRIVLEDERGAGVRKAQS